MAHLDHTFGIEIEFYLPDGATRQKAAEAVSARLGTLMGCREESYNHSTRTWWKLVTDRSLGDMTRGTEAVSPVLQGEDGFRQIVAVLGALSDFGCTVSKACGVHIHVGVGAPSADFFKHLFKLYAHFEPVIDRFMPASRRASANVYTRSLSNVSLSAIDQAADLSGMIRLMTSGGAMARYHKLNLDAYRVHRTVEFRQHAGTLDGNKATRWTELCLRMVDAAKRGVNIASGASPAPTSAARAGSLSALVGDLMRRPQGVTRGEAMAATGWPSISLPQQARACGLAYTTQRNGRTVRYFAQAPAAPSYSAPAATLDAMFDTLSCPPDAREYFRTRTANLSGNVQWAA